MLSESKNTERNVSLHPGEHGGAYPKSRAIGALEDARKVKKERGGRAL